MALGIMCLLLCFMMIVGDRVAVLIIYCLKVYRYFIWLQLGGLAKELALNDNTVSGDMENFFHNLSFIVLYSGIFIFMLHKNEIEEKTSAEDASEAKNVE